MRLKAELSSESAVGGFCASQSLAQHSQLDKLSTERQIFLNGFGTYYMWQQTHALLVQQYSQSLETLVVSHVQ